MRTAQVETLLKTQDSQGSIESDVTHNDGPDPCMQRCSPIDSLALGVGQGPSPPGNADPSLQSSVPPPLDTVNFDDVLCAGDAFTWEMISIGIDEPLPAQDVVDDL